ncbi:hypothetical protein NQ176_g10295 [Zarea fungicola]|uniref:Uncharacterized protein n=1 Tax=Zarea fungicola TaxID=93591 RepID=A0ACC1MIF7_9HYPO|nr:hypothetical protein NQ176_g10295 [Lecanicillium fungicola]
MHAIWILLVALGQVGKVQGVGAHVELLVSTQSTTSAHQASAGHGIRHFGQRNSYIAIRLDGKRSQDGNGSQILGARQ